jgi:hypothetical protein
MGKVKLLLDEDVHLGLASALRRLLAMLQRSSLDSMKNILEFI